MIMSSTSSNSINLHARYLRRRRSTMKRSSLVFLRQHATCSITSPISRSQDYTYRVVERIRKISCCTRLCLPFQVWESQPIAQVRCRWTPVPDLRNCDKLYLKSQAKSSVPVYALLRGHLLFCGQRHISPVRSSLLWEMSSCADIWIAVCTSESLDDR